MHPLRLSGHGGANKENEMNDKQSELVTKIAEVQAKQAQNKVEQESNLSNMRDLVYELAELAAELAEAKKPKMRHGDYGRSDRQDTTHLVISDSAGALRWSDFTGGYYEKRVEDGDHASHFIRSGNIFDDLAALQEDLTEFEMEASGADGRGIFIKAKSKNFIKIGLVGKGDYAYDLKELEEYSLNIRKVIATLKRNEATK